MAYTVSQSDRLLIDWHFVLCRVQPQEVSEVFIGRYISIGYQWQNEYVNYKSHRAIPIRTYRREVLLVLFHALILDRQQWLVVY